MRTHLTVCFALLFLAPACQAATPCKVRIDFDKGVGPMRPVHGIGQGPLVDSDNFELFRYLKEAGIPYARLHDVGHPFGSNVFVDIPNLFRDFDADENDPKNYDFAFTDLYLKNLIENGVEPYFRLGVSIENAALRVKAYHIHPPKDFAKWARICEHVIRHYTEGWADGYRWKIDYWEIWNEADDYPPRNCMWRGTWRQFCEFYDVSAKHLKKRFPHLKIGGYGKCTAHNVTYALKCAAEYEPRMEEALRYVDGQHGIPESEQWVHKCFLEFCQYVKEHGVPLDFFSFHGYVRPEVVKAHVDYHRKHLAEVGRGNVELHLNEWLCGKRRGYYWTNPLISSLVAGYLVAMQQNGIVVGNIYDGECREGPYSPLFDPVLRAPAKPYWALKDYNVLYRLGTEVPCDVVDAPASGAFWALAAKGPKGAAALFVNTSDRPVDITFDFCGRTVAGCRLTDAGNDDAPCPLPGSLPPTSFVLVTFR